MVRWHQKEFDEPLNEFSLTRWSNKGKGPPYFVIGNIKLYLAEEAKSWLRERHRWKQEGIIRNPP